jgi:hypothetical protein
MTDNTPIDFLQAKKNKEEGKPLHPFPSNEQAAEQAHGDGGPTVGGPKTRRFLVNLKSVKEDLPLEGFLHLSPYFMAVTDLEGNATFVVNNSEWNFFADVTDDEEYDEMFEDEED